MVPEEDWIKVRGSHEPVVHIDNNGRKCDQVGRKMDIEFYNVLNQHVTKIDEQTVKLIRNVNSERQEALDMLTLKNRLLIDRIVYNRAEDSTITLEVSYK
jgi:hypothetical protein